MFDLIIVGGGPAGASAGVYAARKRLKTVLVAKEWGGQSAVSDNIQNWIGSPTISGVQLAENLRKHVESYAGDSLSVVFPDTVVGLKQDKDKVTVALASGKKYEARAVLITAGATRRKLEIPGALEYDQRGLTYCATCDGPLYKNKTAAVVGGGDSAMEEAIFISKFAKEVIIIQNLPNLTASKIMQERAKKLPNIKFMFDFAVKDLIGEKKLEKIKIVNVKTKEEQDVAADGVFIAIGRTPNTKIFEGQLKMERGYIITSADGTKTSVLGVYSAGDVSDHFYRQAVVAAGRGAMAAIEAERYLENTNN